MLSLPLVCLSACMVDPELPNIGCGSCSVGRWSWKLRYGLTRGTEWWRQSWAEKWQPLYVCWDLPSEVCLAPYWGWVPSPVPTPVFPWATTICLTINSASKSFYTSLGVQKWVSVDWPGEGQIFVSHWKDVRHRKRAKGCESSRVCPWWLLITQRLSEQLCLDGEGGASSRYAPSVLVSRSVPLYLLFCWGLVFIFFLSM